jgi:hypothetical protein
LRGFERLQHDKTISMSKGKSWTYLQIGNTWIDLRLWAERIFVVVAVCLFLLVVVMSTRWAGYQENGPNGPYPDRPAKRGAPEGRS